ncbi:MAG: NAD(P)/FAD-dependent oxidoreductase [Caldimonas sp.]
MFIDTVFDAIVIGGGPAGLSGALALARLRRSVLLVDAGRGRAARIRRALDWPGFAAGVEGAQLVAAMQHQALRHGVNFAVGRVDRLERKGRVFEVAWPDAQAHARTVLFATGAADVEPDAPHLREAFDAGVLRPCPMYDGYELIDRVVGIVGDGPAAVAEALQLRHFTSRIHLFALRPDGFDADERIRLDRAGIAVVDEPTHAIRRRDGAVAVEHGATATVCDALYSALGLDVHSDLASRLGAGRDADGYLLTDEHRRTGVAGLYAAGDVALGPNQISVATGGAATAAAAMHRMLAG